MIAKGGVAGRFGNAAAMNMLRHTPDAGLCQKKFVGWVQSDKRCGIKPFGRSYMEELGGEFYAVNIACLDNVSDEELANAPVQYENGRSNDWSSSPAETRHL